MKRWRREGRLNATSALLACFERAPSIQREGGESEVQKEQGYQIIVAVLMEASRTSHVLGG